jgi:hypothetical protein
LICETEHKPTCKNDFASPIPSQLDRHFWTNLGFGRTLDFIHFRTDQPFEKPLEKETGREMVVDKILQCAYTSALILWFVADVRVAAEGLKGIHT